MTDLELLRAMGMSQNVYDILRGNTKYVSGFAGILKTRMGIIYPGGAGVELHPRVAVLGSLFARIQALKDKVSR
jgi:accessory colonization factor AcfC